MVILERNTNHGMWHKRLWLQGLSGDMDCWPLVSGNDATKHFLPSANTIQRFVREFCSSNPTD